MQPGVVSSASICLSLTGYLGGGGGLTDNLGSWQVPCVCVCTALEKSVHESPF